MILFHTVSAMYAEGTTPIVYESGEVIEEKPKIVLIETVPTVLSKIADCESGVRKADGTAVAGSGRHFDENGTVVIGQHTDPKHGLDVGKHQINTKYHLDRAKSLGIDIFSEEGNFKYARLLYKEQGTKAWTASKECWYNM